MKETPSRCHIVALPYPGRGHINPMMNFCKLLVSKPNTTVLVSIVVTEEWLRFLGSEETSGSEKIRFRTIPNVIPSELVRAADMEKFIQALNTEMEPHFEQLLDQLDPPASLIMADTFLSWTVCLGNRRNIPVASFWCMSATVFSLFHHWDLFTQNGHFPVKLSENGHQLANYIPGLSPIRLADLPPQFTGYSESLMNRLREGFSRVPKAQYLLISTMYEIEPQAVDALKQSLAYPIYTIGPAVVPHSDSITENDTQPDYFRWLDRQPARSVLYVSMGSYLSFSATQVEEIAAGLCQSGVRFLWVARGEATRLQKAWGGDTGLMVPWCEQLKVLHHPSVGGFWTHCGWNSVQECLLSAGVPMLTWPLAIDQLPNSKVIVEDWRIGWKVKEEAWMGRERVAGIVKKFMDSENAEVKEMCTRVKELQRKARDAGSDGGSMATGMGCFLRDISSSLC
ncbi:unnamed protein product [Linum trigynum]|uniref:Uncharacterized protein n=1 Tax=Linum trigynum TaxID=586398 RepID=A0AAV2G7G1_9ROSI